MRKIVAYTTLAGILTAGSGCVRMTDGEILMTLLGDRKEEKYTKKQDNQQTGKVIYLERDPKTGDYNDVPGHVWIRPSGR